MNEHDDQQIRDALQQTFPPVDTELVRDLWPDVLRRLETRPQTIPWYDWALLAVSAAALAYFPRLVFLLAYNL